MSTPAEKRETMVRVYKKPKDYERDAAKMAKDSWSAESVTERRPRSGIGRIATLGFGSLVFPPKPELVVTYARTTLNKGYVRCFACGVINRDKKDKGAFCTKCGAQLAA
jgi:hypothetical protein